MKINLAGLVELDYIANAAGKIELTDGTLTLIHSGHEFNLFDAFGNGGKQDLVSSIEQALGNQSKLFDAHD